MKKYFDTKETIFDNGLKLISIKKNTRIASVNLAVKIGSLYEEEKERGLSHFIEHMLFKGTDNRNNEQLNDELEQLGGEYNAYTDYTSTVYTVTSLCEELPKAVELLSDMAINSNFDREELEKERGVILAEIRTSNDDIEDFSFRAINYTAFKHSPLKYDTIGEEKTVKNFSRENLIDYYKSYYVPNNCCIVVVSSYEHQEIINLVGKYFNCWRRKSIKKKEIVIEENNPIREFVIKNDMEQSTIMYLYTFHHLEKNKELVLKILNHRFGESSNSILFRELREKRGLAYDVYTNLDLTKGVKNLYIYTSVAREDVDEALKIIDSCINDVKEEKIIFDGKAIDLMRKILKTSIAATIEDSTALCSYVLGQVLEEEDIYEFEKHIEELNNISKEHIYGVAREVFNNPTVQVLLSEEEN
ncbi:M16 family metallopeptidase [Haloimpatiens lingqiaonensis]|uniref:M16 family metallopeptidase n=1 Tax=Haloimpatiens lingqiaonensis TaxID=1380675 RepID=UPI0010FD7326|nr:pitrilysin family protein [Haloimpatiens lingqiaonensis]